MVTNAMSFNPSFPGARYKIFRFTGGDDVVTRVIFPIPTIQDHAYTVRVENRSAGVIRISDQPAGISFLLRQSEDTILGDQEISLEDEIQDAAATSWTYRTEVLFTPEGAFRIPGFTRTAP